MAIRLPCFELSLVIALLIPRAQRAALVLAVAALFFSLRMTDGQSEVVDLLTGMVQRIFSPPTALIHLHTGDSRRMNYFMNSPLFALGMPGWPEIVFILVIVLLLFGAKKLPELARGIGQSLGEFKRAKDEFEREIHKTTLEVEIKEPAEKQPHKPA